MEPIVPHCAPLPAPFHTAGTPLPPGLCRDSSTWHHHPAKPRVPCCHRSWTLCLCWSLQHWGTACGAEGQWVIMLQPHTALPLPQTCARRDSCAPPWAQS